MLKYCPLSIVFVGLVLFTAQSSDASFITSQEIAQPELSLVKDASPEYFDDVSDRDKETQAFTFQNASIFAHSNATSVEADQSRAADMAVEIGARPVAKVSEKQTSKLALASLARVLPPVSDVELLACFASGMILLSGIGMVVANYDFNETRASVGRRKRSFVKHHLIPVLFEKLTRKWSRFVRRTTRICVR